MVRVSEEKEKIKKRVFLGLLLLVFTSLLAVTAYFFLFLSAPETYFSRGGALLLTVLLLIMLFLFILGFFSMVFTLIQNRSFPGLNWFMDKVIPLLFPLVLSIGRFLHIAQDKIQNSFIEVNNQLVRTRSKHLKRDRILLLLPHCLQKDSCSYKITHSSSNCHGCGECQVAEILELAFSLGINVEVVTGGTLARRAVEKYHPQAVVAVACERDLSSGILDSYPLPVLGVVNERPNGPCYNTMVDMESLRETLSIFTEKLDKTSTAS